MNVGVKNVMQTRLGVLRVERMDRYGNVSEDDGPVARCSDKASEAVCRNGDGKVFMSWWCGGRISPLSACQGCMFVHGVGWKVGAMW